MCGLWDVWYLLNQLQYLFLRLVIDRVLKWWIMQCWIKSPEELIISLNFVRAYLIMTWHVTFIYTLSLLSQPTTPQFPVIETTTHHPPSISIYLTTNKHSLTSSLPYYHYGSHPRSPHPLQLSGEGVQPFREREVDGKSQRPPTSASRFYPAHNKYRGW